MSNYHEDNRNRLVNTLAKISASDTPDGWESVGGIYISSFIGFGFSRSRNNLALVVTQSGRSLIDCNNAVKVARDYEESAGLDESGLFCAGLQELSTEQILIAGHHGGGIRHGTDIGEHLQLHSPNWPRHDLYFCGVSGHPLFEKFQSNCIKLRTDFIEAFGFSWCGNYFAVANSSNFDIWKRT